MADESFPELLSAVAARQPTPGGGAVASWVGALGGALAEMAANYSLRKKTPAEVGEMIVGFLAEHAAWVELLLAAADEDASAYGELNRLQKLAADDAERKAQWGGAVDAAIAVPLSVVEICLEMLEAQRDFAEDCNKWLLSDLAIAAILAESAVRSAAWNVRVNLPLLEDPAVRADLTACLQDALGDAALLVKEIEGACAGGD